jgi:hypothetical protein
MSLNTLTAGPHNSVIKNEGQDAMTAVRRAAPKRRRTCVMARQAKNNHVTVGY